MTKEQLETLIAAKIPEGTMLDYKQAVEFQKDVKSDVLIDITALANLYGGRLVIGVREERNTENVETGVPAEITGFQLGDANKVKEKIDSWLRDSVEPQLHGISYDVITGYPEGEVLVINVQRSFTRPHAVKRKNGWSFYKRTGVSNTPMDYSQLKQTFVQDDAVGTSIQQWVSNRVISLQEDNFEEALAPGPRVIYHALVPAGIAGEFSVDPRAVENKMLNLRGVPATNSGPRYFLDGIYRCSNYKEGVGTHFAIFRNGSLELNFLSRYGKSFPIEMVENLAISFAEMAGCFLQNLGYTGGVQMQVTAINVEGLKIDAREFNIFQDEAQPLRRNELGFPTLYFVDTVDMSDPKNLLSFSNALWQAFGISKSRNFDDQGNFRRR